MAAPDLALGTSISWGPHRGGPPPPSPEDYVCYSATFDSILEFGFPVEDSLTTPLIWTEMGLIFGVRPSDFLGSRQFHGVEDRREEMCVGGVGLRLRIERKPMDHLGLFVQI
jgi:hypothetical protein